MYIYIYEGGNQKTFGAKGLTGAQERKGEIFARRSVNQGTSKCVRRRRSNILQHAMAGQAAQEKPSTLLRTRAHAGLWQRALA